MNTAPAPASPPASSAALDVRLIVGLWLLLGVVAPLSTLLLRGPLTSVALDDDTVNGLCTVRFIAGSTMGNGNTYREAGLFNDNNVCYARAVFPDVAKNNSKILIVQWDLMAA